MRKGITLLALAAAGVTAFALTPAETNEILKTLSCCIQLDGHITDRLRVPQPGEPIVYEKPAFVLHSYEELFEDFDPNDVGGSLTAQERRDVFEAALWSIPSLPTNCPDRGLYFGDNMLYFCTKHNQTNFLPLAEQILLSPRAPWLRSARKMFEKFARPSEETNEFVENAATNLRNSPMIAPHLSFVAGYKEVLLRWKGETDGSVFSNAVKVVHRSIGGKIGGSVFDQLMVASFSDYAMSSNRLSFAISVLAADPLTNLYGRVLTKLEDGYFTPITNALLNASEPLKVLDLYWLDERSANDAVQPEQQEEADE